MKYRTIVWQMMIIMAMLGMTFCKSPSPGPEASADDYLPSVRDTGFVSSYDDTVHFNDLYRTAAMRFEFKGKTKADFE
jgi:hypothetical protein